MVKFTRIQMIIMTIYDLTDLELNLYKSQDLYQLRPREARWIRELATWNKRIEGRTRTENREDKVERIFVI